MEGSLDALAAGETPFHRRIEFHLARKPFNGFGNGLGGFHLETLNPSSKSDLENATTLGPGNQQLKKNCRDFDPELSLDMTFRKIMRIGAGLQNLGNTCYLNAVLQCLTYTEPLAAYLESGKHQNTCRKAGFCALCSIQKHVTHALQATGRILAPKDLVSNLRCISRNFRNARQEDAHEYMVNLLESMHKCCLPSGISSESPNAYERSLVHRIFGGRLRSRVKCMQCSFCSDKLDPFLDISLEILKADSLDKAFERFTAQELLDGGDKQYNCQQCKQKVRACKQLTIDKAPHVLTVHLKRFGSHLTGQKIVKKIHYGPVLDLNRFMSTPLMGELKYTLYGVLVHAGWSTHSGHYYCFVRTSSGMWYSLDDNQVIQVNEKKVLDQKAYMLFYVRDRKSNLPKPQADTNFINSTSRNQNNPISTHQKTLNGTFLKEGSTLLEPMPISNQESSGICSAAMRKEPSACDTNNAQMSLLPQSNISKFTGQGENLGLKPEKGEKEETPKEPDQLKSNQELKNDAQNQDIPKKSKPLKKGNRKKQLTSHFTNMRPGSLILHTTLFPQKKRKHQLKKRLNPMETMEAQPVIKVQNPSEVNMEAQPVIKDQNPSEVMELLTRGLEVTTVTTWDGIQRRSMEMTGQDNIGYVGDEWDQLYDQGRRKKIRSFKHDFGGPNLFQEIANKHALWDKKKRAMGSSGQPFRIQ